MPVTNCMHFDTVTRSNVVGLIVHKCQLDAKAIVPEVRGSSRKRPKRSTGAILMYRACLDTGISILMRGAVQMSSVILFAAIRVENVVSTTAGHAKFRNSEFSHYSAGDKYSTDIRKKKARVELVLKS